ncbi:MAG TPA: YeeE/YedE thiosulfate transporter family protein [Flavisolibacter sp.]|nr:YeeE/YedE thiosulfate transporter family protein [Flavisolibacter sp.]
MIEVLRQPLPWYIAGPLIGVMVPALLILGNKSFGISSSLRHICAMCIPSKIPFFSYDWKQETWNLYFAAGILIGGVIAGILLYNPQPVQVNQALVAELSRYAIDDYRSLVPPDLFNWNTLFTLKGFLLIVMGGFLVGFGTRYAGGCTSGHSIMGLSNLQVPSLIATFCFMAGGFLMANLILPYILMIGK